MYFILSKTFGLFLVPTNLIVCLAILSVVLMVARFQYAKAFSLVSLSALVVAACSPLGNMLLTPLEQRFPGMVYPERVDGIIVLGGSYDSHAAYLNTVILGDDTERIAVIASLAKRYPDAKIVFSGGTASLFGRSEPLAEADIAKQIFISFGIAPARLVVEDHSRNTAENARNTARLIEPSASSRWLLVTSAYHMPRAVGAFRREGFNVSAFPVGWRTHGWRDFYWPAPSATENLRRVDVATREWVGLIAYRALGYSAQWLPGPAT